LPAYMLFVQPDPTDALTWKVLKKGKTVECEGYGEALTEALTQARAEGHGGVPAEKIRLTVAVVSSRNWNRGTANVQLMPVTEWED
jgi:hypothetical protein